ncbi:unnamed protein product, partial [Brachionus calyciflorus]
NKSNTANKSSTTSSLSSNLEPFNVKSNSKVLKPSTISANSNSMTPKSSQDLNHLTMQLNTANKVLTPNHKSQLIN